MSAIATTRPSRIAMACAAAALGLGALLGPAVAAQAASPASAPVAAIAPTASGVSWDPSDDNMELGAGVMVINETSQPITVTPILGSKIHGASILAPGQTAWVVGERLMGADAFGTVEYADKTKVEFWAKHPDSFGFGSYSAPNWDYYQQGQAIAKNENGHAFNISRQYNEDFQDTRDSDTTGYLMYVKS